MHVAAAAACKGGCSGGNCAPRRAAPRRAAPQAGELPLMLRALKGEAVERPPVWMMRQAGRYMKVYQELCKKHTTFRERSENVDIAVGGWVGFTEQGGAEGGGG